MTLIRRFCVFFTFALMQMTATESLAQASVAPAGTWHGAIETPIGPLMLVVTIDRGTDGKLTGTIESRDQAPGKPGPLDTVSTTGDRLEFSVAALHASFAGKWSEADKSWHGTFSQGTDYPLILATGDAPAKPVIAGLDGRWTGTITRNGIELRQALRISTGKAGTTASYDSIDQMLRGAPVRDLAKDGSAVRFSLLGGSIRFAGTLNAAGDEISGALSQPGQPDVSVSYRRQTAGQAATSLRRPQEPKPPFPYKSEDVLIANPSAPGVNLAGTFTLPEGPGPFPAAILVTGSGPQDRDETMMGHKPFAVIADRLTRSGFAVLRMDDRGTGKSSGDFRNATTADFATDINAAFSWLSQRSDIREQAIGLIGHSEGAMVAPIAMASNPEVAFLIMLAGPGTRLDHLMMAQQRLVGEQMGRSSAEMDRSEPVMAAVFSAVARSRSDAELEQAVDAILTPDARAALGIQAMPTKTFVQQFSGPWLRYFLNYDPAPNLRRIKVPVLALNGSLDRQVPANENLPAIRTALSANRDLTVVEFPGLNHLFQTAKTGGIGEYQTIEETISPAVLDLMTQWLQKRFKAK